MWRGSSETFVDLHPLGESAAATQLSIARGAGDGEQVGVFITQSGGSPAMQRAALWRGTADSFIDLTPGNFPSADAKACVHGVQVGQVSTKPDNRGARRAALWTGSGQSFVNLHDVVPAPWTDSWAVDVQVDGSVMRVLGGVEDQIWQDDSATTRARQLALWTVTLS